MDRLGRGYSFEVLRAKLLLRYSCHNGEKPPARFAWTPLVMGRVYGFGMMTQDVPGRHLGIDKAVRAGWLDTLPAGH